MGGLRALALLVLAGCAQLFGIDNTTSAVTPDAPPPTPMVSLSFDRLSIGATVVRAPQPLDPPLMATYLVPDATDPTILDGVPAMQSASNTWSATIATGTPAADFNLPDYPTALERQWSFARTMYGLFGQMEHPNRQPAPSPATIRTTITLPSGYVSTESFQMFAIGTWAIHGFLAAELPAPNLGATAINTTLAYDTAANHFQAITGRPLDAITSADAVLVLRYVGNQLTGQLVASFGQTGADTVSGAMAAVAASSALDVTIQPAMPQTRFGAVRPSVANIAMGWDLRAAPGYLYANNNGPLLAAAALTPASAAKITQAYGNPFVARGWNAIFNWNNYEYRTVTVAGPNLPTTLYAGLQQLAEPAAALSLTIPAPLPITISLDGIALSADNLSVKLDATKPATASFVADRPGSTYTNVQVYELVPNAPTGATSLVYQFRYSASGFGTSYEIPPSVLQVGHYYTIRANCITGGYPAINSGDLTQRDLPFSQGYADSGVFTVTQ